MKKVLYSLLFVQLLSPASAQSFTRDDINKVADFIASLQYTHPQAAAGAIRISINPALYTGNGPYYQVNPYFNHIACLGLLQSEHKNKLTITRNWMNWYIDHLDNKGQLYNFYYRSDGSGETTCPNGGQGNTCNKVDAQDSHPALFWILLYEFYKLSPTDPVFEKAKTKIDPAAKFVIDSLLQKSDSLTIASTTYPLKYTMDNSEVYKGFETLSLIQKRIYKNETKAACYMKIAMGIKQAIQTTLYNDKKQLYKHHFNTTVKTNHWYDTVGVTAAVWPQLFEVESTCTAKSEMQRVALDKYYGIYSDRNWSTEEFIKKRVDRFTWPSIGYLFSLAGDTCRGFQQADYISKIFINYADSSICTAADAGWLIMNMRLRFTKKLRCKPGCATVAGNAGRLQLHYKKRKNN